MGGGSSQDQSTQQSSESEPWAPTQPVLQGILGQIGSILPAAQPNSVQTGALQQLQANAQNMPNYTPQAVSLSNDLSAGGIDRTGVLNNAYSKLQGNLSPYTSSSYLDPTKTPGLQNVLSTIQNDVSNNVNGMFAGAGRDLSGANIQTLARGIAQGEAQPLLDQYNQNVTAQQNAASALYGAGTSTAAGLSGLDQTALGNRAQGLNVGLNSVPQAQNAQPNAVLSAQSQAFGLPISNLAQVEGLTIPIAGLGQQTSGNSSTQGNAQMSPVQEALGWSNVAKNVSPKSTGMSSGKNG